MRLKRYLIQAAYLVLLLGYLPFAVAAVDAQSGVTARAYGNVNVRSGPSTLYPIIGQLSLNQSVNVTGRSDTENNWLRIDFNDADGWVAFFTVSVEGDTDDLPLVVTLMLTPVSESINAPVFAPTITDGVDHVYATLFRRVNVRSGPGTGYMLLETLRQGDTAEIIGRSADNLWLQIQLNEDTGWVSYFAVSITGVIDDVPVVDAADTRFTPTPTASPTIIRATATPTSTVVTLITRFNANIRAEPAVEAAILRVVPYGTTLEIEARTEDASWLRVTFEDETGWLAGSLVSVYPRSALNSVAVDDDIERVS